MAKKYTRKQVNSLDELDLEQERIKYKARRIEDDWLDIVQPQQLAISLITGLVSRGKRKAAAKQERRSAAQPLPGKVKERKNKESAGPVQQALGAVTGIFKRPATKSLLKKTVISFLRWQAFNLAWHLGTKTLRKISAGRQRKKHNFA